VGCGTGQWGFELAREFPEALVVGLDLVASKPDRPANYRWVKGNLLHGLPFTKDRFDFVHQRLLVVAVPLAAWPDVVADLVRVARPGAWIELVEPMMAHEGTGPAIERLDALTLQLAASRGLDTTGVVFSSLDEYLRQAGLAAVTRRQISIPIGPWGGRVGTLMATDVRAGYARLGDVLQARLGITADECRDLLQRSHDECEQLEMSWTFAVAHGQKL
jgi:SAM-dependent methyltransferase